MSTLHEIQLIWIAACVAAGKDLCLDNSVFKVVTGRFPRDFYEWDANNVHNNDNFTSFLTSFVKPAASRLSKLMRWAKMYCQLEGILCFLDFSACSYLLGVGFVAPFFWPFFFPVLILFFWGFFDLVNLWRGGLHLFHHHQLLQILAFFFSPLPPAHLIYPQLVWLGTFSSCIFIYLKKLSISSTKH